MPKPTIAITMGDPAGIGPELVIKTLSKAEAWRDCAPFIVGDPDVMRENMRILLDHAPNTPRLEFHPIASLAEACFAPPVVDVLCPKGVKVGRIPWGVVDPTMGKMAMMCLEKAYELAMQGEVHGVVSAPLNKEAFHLAGYDYLDELVRLADFTHSADTFLLGVMNTVWTITVSEHVPFRQIADRVKQERVLWCIRKMHEVLQRVGSAEARIAVAALNVHGGEGGLYGREEIDEIRPAIEAARAQGMRVAGPMPADTVFLRALGGEFDGVVAMYHDQANIARKLQPRSTGATIFMGLPVVCGTTAHGTAFDRAGQGTSDPGSLEAALHYTIKLAGSR
jgi:4-phospho-D-threonate 3-dehydrogenase / 4-phospho-D-erythronate 3-dehydrogenase